MKRLLAVAVLASLLVSSATSAGFDFYKLSLMWPTSRCNVIGFDCVHPIPKYFTIRGLWPEFANDTEVPPYDKDKTCTGVIPTPPDKILAPLKPLAAQSNIMWPYVLGLDIDYFWEYQWAEHGMCSDYPNCSYDYFKAVLTLVHNSKYDPLKVMGIQPPTYYVQVKTVLENVKRNVGAYPQISCNTLDVNRYKVVQLEEIRLYFYRTILPSRVRDCPNKLVGDCKQLSDLISFPPPPN